MLLLKECHAFAHATAVLTHAVEPWCFPSGSVPSARASNHYTLPRRTCRAGRFPAIAPIPRRRVRLWKNMNCGNLLSERTEYLDSASKGLSRNRKNPKADSFPPGGVIWGGSRACSLARHEEGLPHADPPFPRQLLEKRGLVSSGRSGERFSDWFSSRPDLWVQKDFRASDQSQGSQRYTEVYTNFSPTSGVISGAQQNRHYRAGLVIPISYRLLHSKETK